MKPHLKRVAVTVLLVFAALVRAQGNEAQVATYINAARKAAGQDFAGLFSRVCAEPGASTAPAATAAPARPAGPPERSAWYAEPVKVFDNLYFVGQTEYSAWAVTTSEGIIIDTIFVIGADGVQRYMTVVNECARAGLARIVARQ